jgi:hypothetical protein
MSIAKPRWTYKASRLRAILSLFTFELEDGSKFVVLGSDKAIDAVRDLPYDYLELGALLADQEGSAKERQYKAIVEDAQKEIQILRDRIEAAPEAEKIVLTLCEDLEKAINMMMRVAQALGMMAQGPLYEEVQALASKYGMTYRAPSRKQVVADAYEREILGANILEAEFNPITGKLELGPAPGATIEGIVLGDEDDPFDYHAKITRELPSGE